MKTPEPQTYYAIKHIASQKFLGNYEDSPVDSHYGQYCEKVAIERRLNMNSPKCWEIIVAPFQGKWKD